MCSCLSSSHGSFLPCSFHSTIISLHISKKIIFCTLKDSKKNVFDSFPELLNYVPQTVKTTANLEQRTCSAEQGKSCTNVDRAAHVCVQRCNPLLSPRTTASRTPGRFDTVKSSPRSYSLCSTASPCSTSRISVHPNVHTST